MDYQLIIVAIIVAACLVYAGIRIRKALRVKPGDPCYGCALKDACKKNKSKDCKPLLHANVNDAQARRQDKQRRDW